MPKEISVTEWEEGISQLLAIETYLENMLIDLPMTHVWKILIEKPLDDVKQEVGCDAHSV